MRCEECDRLWKTYQLATVEDFRLSAKLDAAVIFRDKHVDTESRAAQKARASARQALADHQKATGHT
jgi:hypothetical protein